MTAIGLYGFTGCSSLNGVTLPASLAFIDGYAFDGCGSLSSLTIPSGVELADSAFNDYNGRLYVASLNSAIARTISLQGKRFLVTGNDDVALWYECEYDYNLGRYLLTGALEAYAADESITSAEIPAGVTVIPYYAFSGCIQQEQAIIPDTVRRIDDYAFPMAAELLTVGCTAYSRTWAATAGYLPEAEAGATDSRYRVAHRDEEIDPAIDPTCTETGLTEGLHCNACGETLIVQQIVPALGHDWSEPTYAWLDDGSAVTATRVCARDAEHVETETVQTTSAITREATCEVDGQTTYSAAFANDAFAPQSITLTDIPALGHDWGEATYTWAANGSSATATRVCARDAEHVETETQETTEEITRAATCTVKGQTTYSAVFANDAFAPQTKTLTNIPALGHDWGTPTYTWSGDNSAVTATRVCAHNSAHVETETAQTTWTLVLSPTETTNGERLYTSEAFTNAAFAAQTVTAADVPALRTLSGLKLPMYDEL